MNLNVTSDKAEAAIRSENAFSIPTTPKSAKNIGTLKIFNINYFQPYWLQELGTLGSFLISQAEEGFLWEPGKNDDGTPTGAYVKRACKAGEIAYSYPCEVPKILREGCAVDLRKIAFTEWEGEDVAHDIMGIGPNKRPSQDLTKWGVFLAAGDVPTKQELATAMKALTAKMEELWKQAQSLYLQGPAMIVEISEPMRQADVFLKRQAPWNQEAHQMVTCEGCGIAVFAGAAAHIGPNGCGAVLDEAKVIKLKLKGFEHLWKKGA